MNTFSGDPRRLYRRCACEDSPGINLLYKDEAGEFFHTYSNCRREAEVMMGAYTHRALVSESGCEDPEWPFQENAEVAIEWSAEGRSVAAETEQRRLTLDARHNPGLGEPGRRAVQETARDRR